jgi:hypothetical protein
MGKPEIKRSLGSYGREYAYESNGYDRNRMEWHRRDICLKKMAVCCEHSSKPPVSIK